MDPMDEAKDSSSDSGDEEKGEEKVLDIRPPSSSSSSSSSADMEIVAASSAAAPRVSKERDPLLNSQEAFERMVDLSFTMPSQVEEKDLMQLLDELHHKWVFKRTNFRQDAYRLFELSPAMAPDEEAVKQAYVKNLFQAFRVYMLFVASNLVGSETDQTTEIRRMFSAIFETITFSYEYLSAEHRVQIITTNNAVSETMVPLDILLFRFSFPDYTQNNEFQNLIIFLLHSLYKAGYRKYRGCCYEQIKTKEGYLTHAWRQVMEIKTFVHSCVRKENHYEQWKNLTKARDTAHHAAKFLDESIDTEFPTLDPDRHVFSFHQGIYNTLNFLFAPFDVADLSQKVTAVNYFDLDIDKSIFSNPDWYTIDTQYMQSIYDHQKIPEEAIRWFYIMMGRTLFWVNEKDTWQVILFIKGVAGTGKSTIGRVVSSFFPAPDVAILSSNIERKFGLAMIYDKLLFVCYEVRNNFGLEQAEFQSIVSGEDMSIACKHKLAINTKWRVPGLLLGNEVPGWVDVAGSVNRRTVLGEFKQKVGAPDPTLHIKLFKEMPSLLHKCNVAYQYAVIQCGKKDIWCSLPEYFHETRRNLAASVNSLTAFIVKSDRIEVGANKYMPLSEFLSLYSDYAKANRVNAIKMIGDNYESIFQGFNITLEMMSDRLWLGVPCVQNYLVGVGMVAQAQGGAGAGQGHGGGGGGIPANRVFHLDDA